MTATEPSRNGPTFLVIGAARSGSTYLTRMLNSHPEIAICEPKEPHFLAFAGATLAFAGPGDEETINHFAITDEPRWRRLFRPIEGVSEYGDGSVSTLYYHEAAVENIRTHCPDARMIVILRDPTDRAFSAFEYWTGRGFETETFTRGLDLEEQRIRDGYHHIWHYTRMGFYTDQLRPFIDAFGSDRLLVLGYESFMADKAAGLARCCEFLGVGPFPDVDVDVQVNAGGMSRNRFVTQLLRWIRRIPVLRWVIRKVVPWHLRERVRSSTIAQSQMSADERRRLDDLFAEERAALAALLGDDAPPWAHR
jgi:Sulfotransferase family